MEASITESSIGRRVAVSETQRDVQEVLITAVAAVLGDVVSAADEDGESCGIQAVACASVLSDAALVEEFGCCEVDIQGSGSGFSPSVTEMAGAPLRCLWLWLWPVLFLLSRPMLLRRMDMEGSPSEPVLQRRQWSNRHLSPPVHAVTSFRCKSCGRWVQSARRR